MEGELQDLSDDADYAASQQQGSASMMLRSDSTKQSSPSEPEGAQIVYSKDNVAIHPTQFASERISGRLKLIKQSSALFLTWIPYKGHSSNARLSEKDKNFYAIRAVPFTDIKSIRRHSPALGWQYIIVVLTSGLAYPPLYFYSGGVKEFLTTIKQHVLLMRYAEDANVFLVNNFQNPLQRTLSSLELPRAVSLACEPSNISVDESTLNENQERTDNGVIDGGGSVSRYHGKSRHKVNDPAWDLSIQVLEKFSLVTKFAREATSQLFYENQSDGYSAMERRAKIQSPFDPPKKSSDIAGKIPDESPVPSDPAENVSCLKHKHGEEAATSLGTFELINRKEGRWRNFVMGIELPNYPLPFVLYVRSMQTRKRKRRQSMDIDIVPVVLDRKLLIWGKPRQPPLGSEEMIEPKGTELLPDNMRFSAWFNFTWRLEPQLSFLRWITFLDAEGRVTDSEGLKRRIFYGGLDHKLRDEIWGLLLGYYSYDSTYAEREYLKSIKKSEYETMRNQWQSISSEQAKRFTKFRERKGLVEKDVVRTDRSRAFYEGDDNPNVNILRDILLTYSFYNFDLGYCQGMNDLLSPILFVMGNESEAFWCFVNLMERLGPNFNRDQNGMHSQLFALSKLVELLDSPLHNYFKQHDCLNYFFCFRWILIQFKREFEYEKTMRLWEVLWTHHLSEHLHLYVCVAILKRCRNKIMEEGMDFDTLLKFINELSGHIDLEAALRDAEALCICAGVRGAASIPPGTPPSLPDDDGLLYSQLRDEVL